MRKNRKECGSIVQQNVFAWKATVGLNEAYKLRLFRFITKSIVWWNLESDEQKTRIEMNFKNNKIIFGSIVE